MGARERLIIEDALLDRGYCRSEKSLGARFDTRSLRMSHCAYHSRRRAFSIYVAVRDPPRPATKHRSSEGMFFLAAVRAQKIVLGPERQPGSKNSLLGSELRPDLRRRRHTTRVAGTRAAAAAVSRSLRRRLVLPVMASSSEFPAAGPAGTLRWRSLITPPGTTFTLLHDKNMLAPASASSWCPTMDLLALATTDGQLSLSRLEWNKQGGERENKLWSTNPDAPVTSAPGGVRTARCSSPATPTAPWCFTTSRTARRCTSASRTRAQIEPALADRARVGRGALGVRARRAPPRPRVGTARRRRPVSRRRAAVAGSRRGAPRRAERAPFARRWWITSTRRTTHRAGQRRRARDHRAGRVRGRTPGAVVGVGARAAGDTGNLNWREATSSEDDEVENASKRARGVVVQHATASPDLSRVLVGFGIDGAVANERRGRRVGDDERNEIAKRNRRVDDATARVPLLAARSRELRDIAAHAAARSPPRTMPCVSASPMPPPPPGAARGALFQPVAARAPRAGVSRRTRRLDDWRRA